MARSDKIILTEKDIKQVETMAAFGMTVPRIAAILGISKKTFERRVAENDNENELNDALLKGRAVASYNVIKATYEMAMAKKHPAINIFWLKCREGFVDKQIDIEDEENYPEVK